jgi:serine/threonine protein kinase
MKLRVHHDIKPDNILFTQSTNNTNYDVSFKLADLGLTDFVIKKKKGQDVNNHDAHGTQMYSKSYYTVRY